MHQTQGNEASLLLKMKKSKSTKLAAAKRASDLLRRSAKYNRGKYGLVSKVTTGIGLAISCHGSIHTKHRYSGVFNGNPIDPENLEEINLIEEDWEDEAEFDKNLNEPSNVSNETCRHERKDDHHPNKNIIRDQELTQGHDDIQIILQLDDGTGKSKRYEKENVSTIIHSEVESKMSVTHEQSHEALGMCNSDFQSDSDDFESGESNENSFRLFLLDSKEAIFICWSFVVGFLGSIRCSSVVSLLSRVIPITKWLPEYSFRKFLKDFQAGLVVGCMLVPQSMGYAGVAGLPVERGLYSSFLPLLAYSLLGTSRQMGVGPVAIISLLVSQGLPVCSRVCRSEILVEFQDPYPNCPLNCPEGQILVFNETYGDLASICAVVGGVLQVLLAPGLSFIMNFVPHPVIAGFTSAGGLIIAMSQLEDIMGFSIRKDRLQDGLYDLISKIAHTHSLTCGMGFFAITFLFLMRSLGNKHILCWHIKLNPWISKIARFPWGFVLVVVYTSVSAALELGGAYYGVRIVGFVPPGLPSVRIPPNFNKWIRSLIAITVQITVIGYLESIAVETKFSTKLKYQIQPSQEARALGVSNILAGMVGGYPVTGSFSRSATNASYGSQSPMCNFVTGLIIMFSLLFFTKLFYNMPRNILAAIVIVAAISLVDIHEAVFLWRSSKKEWVLMVFTFLLTGFFALEFGIIISVAFCVIEVLFKSTRPRVTIFSDKLMIIYLPGAAKHGNDLTDVKSLQQQIRCLEHFLKTGDFLVCRVEGDLNFAAASRLKKIISRRYSKLCKQRILRSFIFDLTEMDIIDTTALGALIALVEEVEALSILVYIIGFPPTLQKFMKIEVIKTRLSQVKFYHSLGGLCDGTPIPESHLQSRGKTLARGAGFAVRSWGKDPRKSRLQQHLVPLHTIQVEDPHSKYSVPLTGRRRKSVVRAKNG